MQSGSAGYKGKFMDGAAGSGLDIISGNVVDGRKVVFAINRNQLRGIMQARLPDDEHDERHRIRPRRRRRWCRSSA